VKVEACRSRDEIATQRNGAAYRQSTASELNPGAILDDRFRLTEVISRGGMATIYKAEDLRHLGEFVAVKAPHKEYGINAASSSWFQQEEEIGRRVEHPYVLKFLSIEGPRSRPYLVMEYVRGCTLCDLLEMFRVFPEADALAIAALICEGVQYLHQAGVCHRDLKPENIMICPDETIRIVDFGIAQAEDSSQVGWRSACGTPQYMAPERVRRKRGDARADIYSLGAILYEMLTGVIPFAHQNPDVMQASRVTGDPVAPRQLNPKLSPQAEEIVLRALERNPADRYPSAAAMLADLRAPERVEVTRRCERLQPSTVWRRALRKAWWVALWVFIPVISQFGLFFLLWHHLAKK
jgi:serine/threonine protein kinase